MNYLYYKIYRATKIGSLKDIAEWAALFFLGSLLCVNILVVTAFLRKWNLIPFFFNKDQACIFTVFIYIIIGFYFMYRKKYKSIIAKYENESEKERKRGNLIVWIYVIISFLMIYVVAFYKPGVI